MAKVFRGQVKIQDVKDELERIVDEVNTLIDNYNDALAGIHSNIFSEGAASLAAPGYTLSIGGLKTLMNAYRGCAVGSKVFKINGCSHKRRILLRRWGVRNSYAARYRNY